MPLVPFVLFVPVEPLRPLEPLGRFFMMSSDCMPVPAPLPVPERELPGVSAMPPSLRIVRLEPVPVPGVCAPVAELGVPSAGFVCSGFGLVVEFIEPGVEGAVLPPVWALAKVAAAKSAEAMAVLRMKSWCM